MKRRNFLKKSSSIVLPSLLGDFGIRAYSKVNNSLANMMANAMNTDRILVMVYLNGGNDGLNSLIPLDQYSNLFNARSNIIVPENSLQVLSDHDLGFHPALGDFKTLYEQDKLAIVQNVGYEDQNFSHFRSSDIWMSASYSNQVLNSGWTGRYLDHENPNFPFGYPNIESPHPLAVEIGRKTSLLFQGPQAAMGMSIQDPSFFYDLIDNVNAPVPEGAVGDRIELIRILAQQSEQYGSVVKTAAENITQQNAYPNLNLAEQLKIVARLIAGGLQTKLYLVELGGFDTHGSQVIQGNPLQGTHSNLLGTLGGSIKAFVEDCEFLGIQDRVLGMTFSEFGRRIKSNNSFGSDHGAAAPLFLFGNTVNSGVIGSNPVIPQTVDFGDNLAHEFDFRQVYASIFRDWFCLPNSTVRNRLLGDFTSLGIVKPSLICTPQDECNEDISLASPRDDYDSYSDIKYQTNNEISASNYLGAKSNVSLESNQEVTFDSSFTVEKEAQLSVAIKECMN